MNPKQSINVNRAKQFARKVDAIRVTSKVKAHEPAMDISAPTLTGMDSEGLPIIERKPLHAAGVVKVLVGKSHGTISTPSSYTAWLRAGRPAHPIYNKPAWRAERYINHVAMPTCGPIAAPVVVRHDRDCVCPSCREYQTFRANAAMRLDATENRTNAGLAGKSHAKLASVWFRDMLADMKLTLTHGKVAEPVVPVLLVPNGKPLVPPVRQA